MNLSIASITIDSSELYRKVTAGIRGIYFLTLIIHTKFLFLEYIKVLLTENKIK